MDTRTVEITVRYLFVRVFNHRTEQNVLDDEKYSCLA